MRICDDIKLDFDDCLIMPKRSNLESRAEVDLNRKFKTRHNNTIYGVPIIASNMATGTFAMLSSLAQHRMFTAIAKHNSYQWKNEQSLNEKLAYGFYTIGIRDEDELNEFKNFYHWVRDDLQNRFPIKVIVDVANGYMQKFSKFIGKLREDCPEAIIGAGNICTPEMAEELILVGADAVKCNIGSGKFCRTRNVTGVGVPSLSAILEVSDAVHGLDGLVIADGGCKTPGDICKAFCANADFVMVGTMFAGTDECEGEIIKRLEGTGQYIKRIEKPNSNRSLLQCDTYYEPVVEEKKYKVFYGMSSDRAAETHFDGIKDYRASEGLIGEVPYKGSVNIVVRNILGGLRSCCTYIGARSIKQMGKCATFVRQYK